MALKTRLVIAGDSSSAVAALGAVEREFDQAGAAATRAGAKLDQAGAASERVATNLDQASAAGARAVASLDQTGVAATLAKANLDRVGAAGAGVGAKLSQAANDVTKAARNQQFAIRNVGQQIGDFGLQVQSGAGVARAFSNQIGQLGYALSEMGGKAGSVGAFLTGPWGIALTIAAAVAAPFVEKLLEGGKAADDSADKFAAAAEAADSFGRAQSLIGKVIELTTGKLKTQNAVLLRSIELQARAGIQKAKADAADARKALGSGAEPSTLEGVTAGLRDTARSFGTNFRSLGDQQNRKTQLGELAPLKSILDNVAKLAADPKASPAAIADAAVAASRRIDGLGVSGVRTAKRLEEANLQLLKLGTAANDQLGFQADLDVLGGAKIPGILKPYARDPKPKKEKKGPSQASLDASALGIGDRIAGIEDQYNELPTAIKKANDQLRELGKIKADIDKQPLLPGAEALKDRIAAVGQTIRDSLNKPFDDYLQQQRQSAEIDRLLVRGREDEAVALQDVLRLQAQMGPLTNEQISAVLALTRADRERGLVLRDQRALIQGNIAAVQSFRGALEQTVADALRGRFSLKNILSSLGNSFLNIASQRIVESVFGSTLRALEAKATGSDKVETAATSISSSLGKGSTAVQSFAGTLDSAANTIRSAAARIDGKASPTAANDNGNTSGAPPANDNGGPDIVVTGKLPSKLSGQGAVEQIYGIAEGVLRAIGIKVPPVIGEAIKGTLGKLEKSLPGVLAGAVSGATSSRIILGDRGTTGTIGASIGGAIGEKVGEKVLSKGLEGIAKGLGKYGGPIGSIVGGLLGGLIGGLFQSKPRGTAAVTQNGVSVTGNKDSVRSSLNTLGGQLQSAVQTIADRLGASVGNYDVGFGAYKDYFQVSNSGSDRFLGQTSYAAKSSQALYDGKDAAAALSAAIANAVSDGAIEGVSSKVAAALKSSSDIDKAVTEALKVKDLETALGGVAAQLANEVKAFEKTASDRLRLAKTYGFDIVKVEELNAKQRLALSDKLLRDQVGSLQDLITELTSGSLFEGSAVDKRTALLDQIASVRADANAGVEGAADKLAKLLDQLNTTSKDVYGTTGGFATDQQSIIDISRQAIAAANQRASDALKGSDPALATTNALLDEQTDQNAKLVSGVDQAVELLKGISAKFSDGGVNFAALRNAASIA